ncbi:MAG: response regulator [Oxalobacteraceae bacterium]|nr:response regulator [Oxalobacteraceae bacterium]
MNKAAQVPVEAELKQPTILCVDDEPNILSSLRRLFRTKGYRVLVAESGDAGLQVLATETVDLVISDMRMPEMDGAHFLELVRGRWPDTIRILLTGYADVSSIIEAINRGEIYRYIAKPWDDNDMLLVVRDALERKVLENEKLRLEELTQRQNDELKTLNASLEEKVRNRTVDLNKANDALLGANEKLKTSFLTSIKVFSNLIEMRGGHLAGHSRRVADLARKIAVRMGLEGKSLQEIFIAGLMIDIGKIAFSDEMLTMPVSTMGGDNLAIFRKFPVRGEQLLMPLEDLRGAAKILRSQLERFDGAGFPDALAADAIPIGARILALASDYDSLQIGTLAQRRFRPEEARASIIQGSGKRYDPGVVDAFNDVLNEVEGGTTSREVVLATLKLQPGMVLSRDLISRDGHLLLSADHVLDERLIQQILDFEQAGSARLSVSIHLDRRG